MDAGEVPDLARPQSRGVHHVFRMDGAARRDHIPSAVRARSRLHHGRLRVPIGAMHLRGLGVGVDHARGVDVAVQRIPQRGDVALRVDQRMPPRGFLHADELLIETHVARLGALALQVVKPGLVGGEIETTGGVQADRMTRDRLDFLVQLDRVAL